MAVVYLSKKEASAVIAILEDYQKKNPNSITSLTISQLPIRINNCIDLQCKKRRK